MSWGNLGDFGSVVEVLGGAELGQFPYLGQMKLDVLVCHVGKLPYYGDVLLEVNGTPVSGLTNRDTLAVIRHFREPIRLKTVKPGAFPRPSRLPSTCDHVNTWRLLSANQSVFSLGSVDPFSVQVASINLDII